MKVHGFPMDDEELTVHYFTIIALARNSTVEREMKKWSRITNRLADILVLVVNAHHVLQHKFQYIY